MNSAELNSLKKQMVIKLGTTTNDESAVISNMVDGANAGSLPAVSADDNGKVLKVVDGVWTKAEGGGGSSLVNPILTCTLTLSRGDTSISYLGYENNTVTNYTGWPITGGDTHTLTVLVPYDPYDKCYEWWFTEINGDPRTKTVTNEINCSVTIDADNAYATVTDPTQPASFTLTIS